MTTRRRRLLRDETVAPWLTLAFILTLWWVGARVIGPDAPGAMDARGVRGAPAVEGALNAPRATAADPKVDPAVAFIENNEGDGEEPIVPVAGIEASSLKSTFDEARGGGSRRHEAMDILAPRGTPVVASVDGRVAKLFTSAAGGLTIYQFDEDERYCYYYAHLDSYAPDLTEGQSIERGQVIGYVGTTGNAPPDTPHLHFAIFRLGPDKRWWEGEPLDPITFLR
jgi:murein DD-endopeptidase MepM/ murein hydrolase activator NlpD